MAEYKTPGVYIKEKNAFGTSIVEAETAIPAFIGFTEKALNGDDDLTNIPWKISSMNEYIQYFGESPDPKISVGIKEETVNGEKKYSLSLEIGNYRPLYQHMQLFFANGGGTCYVVSVKKDETTDNKDTQDKLSAEMVNKALEALAKEREVTLIVVPEAAPIGDMDDEYANIQQSIMKHCSDMGNRFAILDVPMGDTSEQLDTRIKKFQDKVTGCFSYGAAYFPWLNTTVWNERNLDSGMFTWNDSVYTNKDNIKDDPFGTIIAAFGNKAPTDATEKTAMHLALYNGSPLYKQAIKELLKQLNLLPPSAAMAGIYTMVDHTRGVWKAPANVSLNYVDSLAEDLDDDEQANLNAPMTGKAINVIRMFRGEGVKVWGARTLDGNSLDWRYINVRRTLLFLEESVKNAARAYVFEPNNSGTWINMKSMIENFLRSVWKRGGLAGATPEDAYEVHVGLGDTMTADDILEGIMRITVLVAVTHPAEFIEITFQQQMQKS